MKKFIAVALIGALSGCVYTSTIESGTQFTSGQVDSLVKGETTKSNLIKLLGQPSSKTVVSETDEKWNYTHTISSASVQAYTNKVNSKNKVHILDLLIRNDVVINFVETINEPNFNVNTTVK